jgi:hypothetical protein
MTDSGSDGVTRDDLVRRIELMEAMIAEGRRYTAHYGWIFVLWGVICLAAMAWQFLQPHSHWVGRWAWPICLAIGFAMTYIVLPIQKRGSGRNTRCRSVEAVWSMMSIAMAIFVAAAMLRNLTWQLSYVAAILMILGLAHAVSAAILRWRAQAVVAAIWWLGGIAAFFARSQNDVNVIFLVEMCFGMILFGLYMMALERRNGGKRVQPNAG